MNTEEKITQIMAEKLGLEQPWPEASFTNDLGIDSLDIFELIIEVENVFHISIPSEDAEKLITPGKLIEYIKSNTS
jgi:acyl carrier protein